MKIALAMIVKGSDVEAPLLDRCLTNMSPFVDGVFVTITQPNDAVENIAKKHGAIISHFEWCNDFSKARNFNFSQVPKDYDYIMWSDADDQWRGLEKLKDTIDANKDVDAFSFWYMYDFDENKSPTVVHGKTMIIRNDGCAVWKGVLHEDLIETRGLNTKFIEGIERMHFTTNERIEIARKRNVDVALKGYEEAKDDPRTIWNLANSYIGIGDNENAAKMFREFVSKTGSEEERYLAMLRLADIEFSLGNFSEAEETYWKCIGMKPNNPDAYLHLGYKYFEKERFDDAAFYILNGMIKKPPYREMVVYNPRDYDYNPMMAMAKLYIRKGRPDLALPMLKGALKIAPENKYLNSLVPELEKASELLSGAHKFAEEHLNDSDEELQKALDNLDPQLQSHPVICILRNGRFFKKESSGKDITYFCGTTEFEWNPILFKTKGFGGSEEAVINLSKEWAKLGYNVTVYNNCGPEPMTVDGVTYKPFWMFNAKDKVDHLIIWRHPKLVDYDVNATNIYIDVHDMLQPGEFNEKRLAKINKIFVKTKFHRSVYKDIPDEKFAIIPNGIDVDMFKGEERVPFLMVNTSSPDRSLGVLPELFKRVKEKVPQARCQWAYGWDNFDQYYSSDKERMEWKSQVIKNMEEAGIEDLGRLPQSECAKLYERGSVFAYPTEFAEIDCISVKKAQLGGAIPVCSDFGAMEESAKYGLTTHSSKTIDTWSRPGQFHFEIEDEEQKQDWVDKCIVALTQQQDRTEMQEWAKGFAWKNIAPQWISLLSENKVD